MKAFSVLLLLVALAQPWQAAEDPSRTEQPAGRGSALANAIHTAGFDPDACYRVRDIAFSREDLRFYLTDGYLILGRPVEGRIYSAAFLGGTEGADAEVIVMPPMRAERASLARFTQTPNLDEHITAAVFLFSDGTGKELLDQIQGGAGKPAPEKGLVMSAEWSEVVRNLSGSLITRLVLDALSDQTEQGLFYSAVTGRKLGNFDLFYDPLSRNQITLGQISFRDNRNFFDVWTNFQARAFRTRRKTQFQDGITLSDFRIDAELADDLKMTAVTRVKLTSTTPVSGAVSFDLSQRMRLNSATIDGRPVELFARENLRSDLLQGNGNGTVLLVLNEPLAAGVQHEVEMHSSGSVIVPAGNGVFFVGSRTNWYPNHGTNFARYDMKFRYPKSVSLVANGDIGEDSVDGDWRITRRRTSGPIRFAGFNLGDYAESVTERGGCTIRVVANHKLEAGLGSGALRQPAGWPRDITRREALTIPATLPASPATRVQQLAQDVASAYEFLAGRFGPPPLKVLTVSPIPGTFGQGFPGLVYLSTISYMDPKDRPAEKDKADEFFYSELLHAHETAHQWWGNLVTSSSVEDDWIMESLANYSALLYLEKRKGRKALDVVMEAYKQHLLQEVKDSGTVESAGPIVWGLRLSTSKAPGAWRVITYEKGSWIIHMLRAQMGDEAFFKMLGQLVQRYRYQPLSTEQFRLHAQEFLPAGFPDKSLETFFEQWVYGTGIPKLALSYKTSGPVPAVKVRGTITQSQVDEDFSALVPVEVQLSSKRTVTQWVRTASDPVSFTVQTKTLPSKVTLDGSNSVLRR